jgi:hypothetical protein
MNIEKLAETVPIDEITLGKIWQEFAKIILPKGCHPIQAMEMKKAFYAGFRTAMEVTTEYSGKNCEDDIVFMLIRFEKECEYFFKTT